MKTSGLLIAVFMIIFSQMSRANIYLEPYVGYGTGSFKADYTDALMGTGLVDGKIKGVAYGGKLGTSYGVVALGVDVMGVDWQDDFTNTVSNATGKSKMKGMLPGAFLGIKLPMIKFGATYFFSSKIKEEFDGGGSAEIKNSGFKVGLGYSGIPFFAINVDYVALNSSAADFDAGAGGMGSFDTFSSKLSFYMVGISFPLDF